MVKVCCVDEDHGDLLAIGQEADMSMNLRSRQIMFSVIISQGKSMP